MQWFNLSIQVKCEMDLMRIIWWKIHGFPYEMDDWQVNDKTLKRGEEFYSST